VPRKYFFFHFILFTTFNNAEARDTTRSLPSKAPGHLNCLWLASVHQRLLTHKLWHDLVEKFISPTVHKCSFFSKINRAVRVVLEKQPTFESLNTQSKPKCIHKFKKNTKYNIVYFFESFSALSFDLFVVRCILPRYFW
jgi:hypothetical protein